MIKNTKYKQKILDYKKKKMFNFRAGIIISTLFLGLSQPVKANTTSNFDDYDDYTDGCFSIEKDYYFEELLENENIEDYDKELLDIIDNGILIYNNQEYELSTLQIKKQKDGSNHVTCYLQTTRDIFTGEYIGYDWEKLSQFANSSIFYQMYEEGIINSKEIKPNKDIYIKYINEWDGEEHDKTPFLKVKKELEEKETKKLNKRK